MAGDYSPFSPIVWALFIAAMLLVVVVERLFRARFPEYPGVVEEFDKVIEPMKVNVLPVGERS
jgi:hypothetical protein